MGMKRLEVRLTDEEFTMLDSLCAGERRSRTDVVRVAIADRYAVTCRRGTADAAQAIERMFWPAMDPEAGPFVGLGLHPDRHECGAEWVGGECSGCGALCECQVCRRHRADVALRAKEKELGVGDRQVLALDGNGEDAFDETEAAKNETQAEMQAEGDDEVVFGGGRHGD